MLNNKKYNKNQKEAILDTLLFMKYLEYGYTPQWLETLSPEEKEQVDNWHQEGTENIQIKSSVPRITIPCLEFSYHYENMQVTWCGNTIIFEFHLNGAISKMLGDPAAISNYLAHTNLHEAKTPHKALPSFMGVFLITENLAIELVKANDIRSTFCVQTSENSCFVVNTLGKGTQEHISFQSIESIREWAETSLPQRQEQWLSVQSSTKSEIPQKSERIYICSPLATGLKDFTSLVVQQKEFLDKQCVLTIHPENINKISEALPLQEFSLEQEKLNTADAVWVLSKWNTPEMQEIIETAEERKIPVYQVDMETCTIHPYTEKSPPCLNEKPILSHPANKQISKLKNEFAMFRQRLLLLQPKQILEQSFRYVKQGELLTAIEKGVLSSSLNVTMVCAIGLQGAYREWLHSGLESPDNFLLQEYPNIQFEHSLVGADLLECEV